MEDKENLLNRIKQLENENSCLKQRLETLERVRTPLGSIPIPKTPIIPSASSSIPTTQSTGDIEIDESLLYYLKSILGYSIKQNKNTITLRSVYAFSSEDIFEIEFEDNKLMLKSTDYLREWGEFFNIYIKNGRSYCAFFSAVTLELYNRKTFGK